MHTTTRYLTLRRVRVLQHGYYPIPCHKLCNTIENRKNFNSLQAKIFRNGVEGVTQIFHSLVSVEVSSYHG